MPSSHRIVPCLLTVLAGWTPLAAVEFSLATDSFGEGTLIALVVNLAAASGSTVTVNVDFAGSALKDVDYVVLDSLPLVFNPGQTQRALAIQVLTDSLTEGDETIVATIGTIAGTTEGSGPISTFTGTITSGGSAGGGPSTVDLDIGRNGGVDCGLEGSTQTSRIRLSAPQAATVRVPLLFLTGTPDIGALAPMTFGNPTVVEAGDDFVVDADVVVFAPGEIEKTITFTIFQDGNHNEPDEAVRLSLGTIEGNAVPGRDVSFLGIVVGQNEALSATVGGAPAASLVIGGLTLQAGQTAVVALFDGAPLYQVAGGACRVSPARLDCKEIATASGDFDPFQAFVVEAVTPGTSTLTISDANGTAFSISLTIIAATLPPIPVAAAGVPPSPGGSTLYEAVCPGTSEGLARLKAFLAGKDATQAKAFVWDGATQAYVQLPTEPTGGLTPTHAVFLATRSAFNLDVSGTNPPAPYTVVLHPGFNFIGLPALVSGSIGVVSHDLATDFLLTDMLGTPVTNQALVLTPQGAASPSAFLWNGSAYEARTALTSGAGFWLVNNSIDGESLLLKRLDNFAGDVIAPLGKSVTVRKLGAPPPPPTANAAGAGGGSGGGGCGHGSGFAALALGLLALARRRWL